MTGTVIAQAIPLAISPILTRLYTPEEFGMFALFISIISIVGVIATARYEFAIMQPKYAKDAYHIVLLCLMVTLVISLVFIILIYIFEDEICQSLNNEAIRPWLYFSPFSVFIMGCFQSFNYWNNRQKNYKNIAQAKVSQSIATVSVNLSTSSVVTPSFGLIIGHVLGQFFAALYLMIKFFKYPRPIVSIKKIIVLSKEYSRYPFLSSPGALINSAALQVPILFIVKFFDMAAVGYFNFIYRIIGGPMALISGALSQVLLQKIASKDYTHLHSFVLMTAKRLFYLSCPIVIFIVLFGPDLFEFVFGEQWRVAGDYSRLLIFSIAIRFVVSPLSMVLVMERFVKWAFYWQVYTLISVIVTLSVFSSVSFYLFIFVFVIQDVISYFVYLWLILKASKKYNYPISRVAS